jgi:predicted N-acetyltransferase YhbS
VLISRAGSGDIEPALRVMSEAFGLEIRAPSVHTFAASAPSGSLVVARDDGRVVGTGACLGFGRTGWIGGVAVAASARGAGLGRALTDAALDALGERSTVLLLASSAGRPIYERLGFEGEGQYRVFMAGDEGARAGNFAPRALTPADRGAVLALDARVTGEDRGVAVDAALAGAVATPELSAVALRPPWPARPILARDPSAGAALLAAVIEPGMRLAVPEANVAAVDALVALGAREVEPVLRMRRGAPVAWRPRELWGVFSLFFG